VFSRLANWLDDRTGFRKLVSALLLEHIPGGAKWRYVWGSALAFVFVIQLITGVLLMTAYSPGDSTAWGSVYYIQYEMSFGWLIRGIHHFGSQAMVVLLGLHMLQVVIAGAHLPPREINWWLGLALMACVLGLSLTGYLLPWDQKGYWATQVATNIAGGIDIPFIGEPKKPDIGPVLQKLIIGGAAYGHQTLTRFYTLHVAILPPLVIILVIAHVAVFRRHGVTTPRDAAGEGWFWPDQAFRDLLVSLAIFGLLLTLVLIGHGHPVNPPADKAGWDYWAHAGRDGKGANLDAPADPASPYPARPEWYFLSLFQLLKYFPPPGPPLSPPPEPPKLFGEELSWQFIGAVLIPGAVGLLLFVLPLLAFGRKHDCAIRRIAHGAGVVVVVALLTAVMALTLLALRDDAFSPLARVTLDQLATRVMPLTGGALLVLLGVLAVLPRGAFRRLVSAVGTLTVVSVLAAVGVLTYLALQTDKSYLAYVNSSSQEPFAGGRIPGLVADWVNAQMPEEEKQIEARATHLLATPNEGLTNADQRLKEEVLKRQKFPTELAHAEESAKRALTLATRGIGPEGAGYLLRRDPDARGRALFGEHCATCHTYGKDFPNPKPTAPDLEGWGTKEWLIAFLRDPGSNRYFGRTKEEGADVPRFNGMADWVKQTRERYAGRQEKLNDLLGQAADWLASHPRDKGAMKGESFEAVKTLNCFSCHSFAGSKAKDGPDFTGYGTAEWLRLMIAAPGHPLRYGENNEMPAFRDGKGPLGEQIKHEYAASIKKKPEEVKFNELTDEERELIIRWLLKEGKE
jgi:ubiquinol-cytochrome c reductase cytochrome b subunit